MSREIPILFSAPMVRAILAGTKTMTRRLVKPQPEPWPANPAFLRRSDDLLTLEQLAARSPYGAPGAKLWVRETFSLEQAAETDDTISYRSDGACHERDGERICSRAPFKVGADALRWKPAIFMPRWASRITLEVTSVRVERLQEISEEDAKAEGVDSVSLSDVPRNCTLTHRDDFAQLWDTINGKKAPWASNPWVFVVSFRRLP